MGSGFEKKEKYIVKRNCQMIGFNKAAKVKVVYQVTFYYSKKIQAHG
jgi:hypothetical protein